MKLNRFSAALSLALVLAFPLAAQTDAPQRYARVGVKDARALTLPDDQANEVVKLPEKTLVAVFRDTGSWLEVEVPGGYPVWIFGRYLKATDEEDVYQINGNGVNLRPKPTAEVSNYPLAQHLYAGDKVRVIERADPGLPLEKDWMRIWTPPGVRAWIAKGDAKALAAGEDGKAAWKEALANLPPAPARAKAAREASTKPAAETKKPPQAGGAKFGELFDAAWKRLEAERGKDTPDWPAVRAAFTEAQAVAPTGADVARVSQALSTLTALEEASSLRAELQAERKRREEEALRRQQDIWERSRAKDPLGDVFLSRGALERVSDPDGKARYFLRFGGELVSEIVCVSGRYDLDLFASYEVGVKGMELVAPDGGSADPIRIEVTRLEILSRRP